jgi:hypothetical protein
VGLSHVFWQQGGIGAALLAQHLEWSVPETAQTAALWAFFGPQQPSMSQQAVPVLQHVALSGWSQQNLAVVQQRVFVAQQFGCAGLSAPKAATVRSSPVRAVRETDFVNILRSFLSLQPWKGRSIKP